MISQLPPLANGDLEKWLLGAAGAASLYVLFRAAGFLRGKAEEFVRQEEFRLFRTSVEQELGGLRDRIDSRHLAVVEKLEGLGNTLLHETAKNTETLQNRLAQVESVVARLDERTRE